MLLIFLAILGLTVGSFLNVLIDRLPNEQKILGRSYCDHCKKKLDERDLIPVVSFFTLGGKCRFCRKKLSWFYPLVELITAAMFVLVFLYAPTNEIVTRLLYIGFFSMLLVVFFADLKYQIIPDQILIVLVIFALGILFFEGANAVTILRRVAEGVIVGFVPLMIYLLTKHKGIGFGDVKLSFVLGSFLGIVSGFLALYFAFILGAAVGVYLILTKKKKLKSPIAFGPFLALGGTIMIFWSKTILRLFSFFLGF